MSVIELRSVSKRFGSTPVLVDVELTMPAASITAVLGASGSGKTTLLRLIAGFEQVDTGAIVIDGRVLDDGSRSVRPQHRGIGYVPQDGALFPHLTVMGNVSFGLSRREHSTIPKLLDTVGLAGLQRRYPHQLSGGQQQRVALARALAIRPSIVLLDEPFSSLDASLRTELGRDVTRILNEAVTTTVLVTHDQNEALALADYIAVLEHGRVLASAGPRSLYRDPPSLAAARSIGEANVVAAYIEGDRARCALGDICVDSHGHDSHGLSRLLLRPEQLMLHIEPTAQAASATVVELRYHGHDALALLRMDHPDKETLLARVPGELMLTQGQSVWLEVSGPGRAWPVERSMPALEHSSVNLGGQRRARGVR